MDSHHTVVDLSPIAVVLTSGAHRLDAAFGRTRLVHATDGLWVGMVLGDDLLAAISELLFIPLDRFQKSLQRPRRRLKTQGDRLGRFAVQVRQLTLDINSQQIPGVAPAETVGEHRQKQSQLPSQRGNLL
jgi:hypothetical protein